MKKLRLVVDLEMTDKDYLKHNVKEIDPLVITRETVQGEYVADTYEGIIPFTVPKEILSTLKKANADIAEITIIDIDDPNNIENYETPVNNFSD